MIDNVTHYLNLLKSKLNKREYEQTITPLLTEIEKAHKLTFEKEVNDKVNLVFNELNRLVNMNSFERADGEDAILLTELRNCLSRAKGMI